MPFLGSEMFLTVKKFSAIYGTLDIHHRVHKSLLHIPVSNQMNAAQNLPFYFAKLIGNKLFETVEQFKYLRTTLTTQNSIHEEIKSRLKSGNACYHSVQNLLSSSLLSKNVKIKIYRTKHNLAGCFVRLWNLVAHIEEGM